MSQTARNSNQDVLKDKNNSPDYKRIAYLDAHSYAHSLDEEIELDKIVKQYLLGQGSWSAVTGIIASEENKLKTPRQRKGPWMKNRRENRNTRKARIYQFTQKAYDQNKKSTIHKIINGNFSLNNIDQVYPKIKDVENTYVERLEERNQVDEMDVDYPETIDSEAYGRFTESEVREVIRDLRRNTAAGTDGIRTPDVRKVPTGHITAIMNYWWGWSIPEESEECRITLLPKKDDKLEEVGNWRRITVGNLFMRLRSNIKLDERQKGFVTVNGCFENVKILQQVIKKRRNSRKEYNLVFIDLAKAFDTVSHRSIEKGLRRKGIPDQVIDTIKPMYENAITAVSVCGKATRKVRINAGVKQGCPLSPLLFNLIIDEVIEKLKKINVGIEIGRERICCMAFADDLVLISEERIHMQMLLEVSKRFLDQKGLRANPKKCASLRVVPAGKKRTMKVITTVHRRRGNEEIPSITFQELVKYFGVDLQHDGSVKLPRETWEKYLQNLMKSHLNPIQKIEAIRQVLVAKIQYQLRLSDQGLEEARKLNRVIRKYVKKILHLPTWTATSWIHHGNGSNIPDLVTTTMISRAKATAKMKASTDPAARATADILLPMDEERLQRLNLHGQNKKEQSYKKMEDDFEKMNNGRAIVTAMNSRHRRNWIWTKFG